MIELTDGALWTVAATVLITASGTVLRVWLQANRRERRTSDLPEQSLFRPSLAAWAMAWVQFPLGCIFLVILSFAPNRTPADWIFFLFLASIPWSLGAYRLIQLRNTRIVFEAGRVIYQVGSQIADIPRESIKSVRVSSRYVVIDVHGGAQHLIPREFSDGPRLLAQLSRLVIASREKPEDIRS